MKQCVAPVSSRTVTRRGPCAVPRNPDRRGLNVGLLRSHARNSGMSVSVANRACQASARASTEAYTWSADCAAFSSSSARCGLHPAGLEPPRPEPRRR